MVFQKKEVVFCTVDGCRNIHAANGLCHKHYMRKRRGGSIEVRHAARREPQWFIENIAASYEGDECLMWPYAKSNGYGEATINGKSVYAHRQVCEIAHGPPPSPKHHAAHSCGQGHRGCVTKRHLSWKTPKENHEDKIIHGTSLRGEKHNRVKLTEDQVLQIRSMRGAMSQTKIGKIFGISQTTVKDIQLLKRWGWLKERV